MSDWQRLSPLMLLVHPVREVMGQLPVLVGAIVVGSAIGNLVFPLIVLAAAVVFGVLRWFFTTYRIDDENIALHTGVLRRRLITLPRNRIRSIQTDSGILHRLLGLTVVRVGTGQETSKRDAFTLDAVEAAAVPRLRATLMADSTPVSDEPAGRVLARWHPSWLGYAPLSFSGLAIVAAVIAFGYQAGVGERATMFGEQTTERLGVALTVTIGTVVLVLVSVVLAVLLSWLTYANLVLRRDSEALYLRHGLLRVREHTYDMSRLRGATLRQPLLVRALRGARVDGVLTGVQGEGESSVLLPACPMSTATAVLTDLIADPATVTGPLQGHGRAAARRRWMRALVVPVVAGAVLAVVGVPAWAWAAWAAVTVCCGFLAYDRVRSLGHRVADGWLVARAGSVSRRRDCLACAGIIGWTVRQTLFQRRAGVATLIAATAAGRKHYEVLDVPAELAWSVAAAASPWVADSVWAR